MVLAVRTLPWTSRRLPTQHCSEWAVGYVQQEGGNHTRWPMKCPGSPGSSAFLSWDGDLVGEENFQRDALAVMYESCVW